MNKRIISIFFTLCLLLGISSSAIADFMGIKNIGTVWFDYDGKSMGNNFQYLDTDDEDVMKERKADPTIADVLSDRAVQLQPGDDIEFRINLKNYYSKSSDWYMTHDIIDSLERGSAQDGAYDYELGYMKTASSTPIILFSSYNIGGDDKSGLEEINSALKTDYTHNGQKYFYLDTLKSGEGNGEAPYVYLNISLDGETQGNGYQERLADLKMNFAVQVVESNGTTTTTRSAPKTGDENNLLPYYVAMIISGLLFLYFALDSYTDRLYKKGKGRS